MLQHNAAGLLHSSEMVNGPDKVISEIAVDGRAAVSMNFLVRAFDLFVSGQTGEAVLAIPLVVLLAEAAVHVACKIRAALV